MDDAVTLQMALVGYQIEKQRIESRIQEIQSQLKGKRVAFSAGPPAAAPRKRELSPAARARIAAAQKKRWAEHRKRAAQAAKTAKSASRAAAAS
jgi:predicted  nucleic acid-binding Zn-ribbon protein